jgi:regulatory protein
MRITKIEQQKKRRGRRNIYADDQFVLGLSDETLLRSGLRTGDEVSPDRLAALQQMEERQRTKRTALRYLSTRPRTQREMRDRLREAECSDTDIAAVMSELLQAGLINDLEFARSFVRDALAHRPSGRMLLRQKMLLLGLEKSLVEQTLEELLSTADQEDSALSAARRYLARKSLPRDREGMQKLRSLVAAHLARRGFSWDAITPALQALLTHPRDPGGETDEDYPGRPG